MATGGPVISKDRASPSTPEGFPDTLDYDAAKRRLLVGAGFIDNVSPKVWTYEVSGKQVLRQWFSYRRKDRERPLIGDKRPPSPLGDIQPERWLPEYSCELINVLNILGAADSAGAETGRSAQAYLRRSADPREQIIARSQRDIIRGERQDPSYSK